MLNISKIVKAHEDIYCKILYNIFTYIFKKNKTRTLWTSDILVLQL